MLSDNLKYKFVLLKGSKEEAKVLIDAINKHIEKLSEDVAMYSKVRNDQNRLQHAVDGIKTLMNMRDNIEYLGSDEAYSARDFPHPIKRII